VVRVGSALKQPRRTGHPVVRRRGKHYDAAALMQKTLQVAQEYLELQHLRIEVEKAEAELRKHRTANQGKDKEKKH
jgi:hypothetical protein